MPGKGRRAALILASSRPPKGIKKAREVTKVTCQEELTSLMVSALNCVVHPFPSPAHT
jgi:hypothetical protein